MVEDAKDAPAPSPDGLLACLRALSEEAGALGPSLASADGPRGKGFAETVRDYLSQELVQHPDAEREAILAIADGLLKDFES